MPSTILDYALAYAQRGWPVFPLVANRKEPAVKTGFKAASTEPAQLRAWWSHDSNKGIGLATGAPAGVWVLDIDKDKGGFTSLRAMLAGRDLPETLSAHTGGGGLHIYFRMPAGEDVRNRADIEPGIDARGTGGYVVVPPSGHQSGLAYRWADESVPVADAPDWLVDLVVRRKPERAPAPYRGEASAAVGNPAAYARSALEREVSAVASCGEGGRNDALNAAAYALARFVEGGWLDREAVASELQLAAEACGLGAAEARKTIASGLGASRVGDLPEVRARPGVAAVVELPTCLPVGDPLPVAEAYLKTQTDPQGRLTLRRWRGGWWRYTGSAYEEVDGEAMESALWTFCGGLFVSTKDGPKSYAPTGAKISNVQAALRSLPGVLIDSAAEPPVWVGDGGRGMSAHVVIVKNGLLDLVGRKVVASSPNLFATSSIPIAWDADAGAPKEWLRFLRQLWGDDEASIQLLQEWFGYCLTPDTSQQKMLMLVGPKRGGKGTISEVLRGILGAANVAGANLLDISKDFGLAPLQGKLVAIFPDVRLSGRSDPAEVAGRLLTISGEDAVSINRKHRDAITAKLSARLMLMSNEVPRLMDASGALASRFLLLQLERSFYGREDHGLKTRLLNEMPAILGWAVEGWARLRERGHFVQPDSGDRLREELEEVGSPIQTFVREMCDVGQEHQEVCSYVYKSYLKWAELQGIRNPKPLNLFGRDLRAGVEGLKTAKGPRPARNNVFVGIRVNDRARAELAEEHGGGTGLWH